VNSHPGSVRSKLTTQWEKTVHVGTLLAVTLADAKESGGWRTLKRISQEERIIAKSEVGKKMKRGVLLVLVSLLVTFAFAHSVLAQVTPRTNSVPPTVTLPLEAKPPPPEGRPLIPKRPVIIPPAPSPHGAPAAGAAANAPQFPSDVKELVQQFQQARDKCLLEQKDLQKQLKDATDEQRAALREKMREAVNQWRDAQSDYRQSLKDLIEQMKSNLQPELQRNVDQGAKEGGRK